MVKFEIDLEERILYDLKKRSEGTGFDSLSEYINFVLEQVIEEDEDFEGSGEGEERVRENLKKMGYL